MTVPDYARMWHAETGDDALRALAYWVTEMHRNGGGASGTFETRRVAYAAEHVLNFTPRLLDQETP